MDEASPLLGEGEGFLSLEAILWCFLANNLNKLAKKRRRKREKRKRKRRRDRRQRGGGKKKKKENKNGRGEGRQYVVTLLHNVSSLCVHSLD